MLSRVLFLCACASARALIAASILANHSADQWDIWSTPTHDRLDEHIALLVLQERGIKPLSSDHFTPALFSMHWDEGIILCSGSTST